MLKKLRQVILFVLAALMLVACATTGGDPRQEALDATYKSAVTLDAAITATRAAVRSGAIKGQDADNAFKAFTATQASLRAAQAAIAATPAASAASGVK